MSRVVAVGSSLSLSLAGVIRVTRCDPLSQCSLVERQRSQGWYVWFVCHTQCHKGSLHVPLLLRVQIPATPRAHGYGFFRCPEGNPACTSSTHTRNPHRLPMPMLFPRPTPSLHYNPLAHSLASAGPCPPLPVAMAPLPRSLLLPKPFRHFCLPSFCLFPHCNDLIGEFVALYLFLLVFNTTPSDNSSPFHIAMFPFNSHIYACVHSIHHCFSMFHCFQEVV